MNAVWLVRSRQMSGRFAFWLSLIGYDRNDHSLSHRIYLVYAAIFWSVWCFAVLALMAGAAVNLLDLIYMGTYPRSAETVSLLALVAWFLITLYQSSRLSPLVFSEDDAYLICQTPVNRSAVALQWFWGDWLQTAIPFWVGSVILGFSLIEAKLLGKITLLDFPEYAGSGLRALIIFTFLQMSLLALAWAVGLLRLQKDRELPWLSRLTLAFGVLITGVLAIQISRSGLAALYDLFWQVFLWPFHFSLEAAFGDASLGLGMILTIGLLLAALALLWRSAREVNIARAAQETTQKEARSAALASSRADLANTLAERQRLGVSHRPSRIPAYPGLWVFPWKDLVQSGRLLSPGKLLGWLFVLGLTLSWVALPDLGARGLAFIVWVIQVGQVTTQRLRKDLQQWALFRGLPFKSSSVLLADLGLPWLVVVMMVWMALITVSSLPPVYSLLVALLAPFLTASISLISAYDSIRQSHASNLMAGAVGDLSGMGALLSLLCVAVPMVMVWYLNRAGWDSTLLALVVSFGLSYFIWQAVSNTLQQIE